MISDDMRAIPATGLERGRRQLTGVTCPSCPGVLTVATNDAGDLQFECRIGHAFLLPELIAEKERIAEERVWAGIEALEELAQILLDSDMDHGRAERARVEANAIRRVLEAMEPANVEDVCETGGDRSASRT